MAIKGIIISALVVTIWVHQMVSEDCNHYGSMMVKQVDGSYMVEFSGTFTLLVCSKSKVSHREVWTDYPEKGGKFLYSVEKMDQLLENIEHRVKEQGKESIESMGAEP